MGLMASALAVCGCAPRQMHPGKVSAGRCGPYQSITFYFVRLIVWNCSVLIGTCVCVEVRSFGWGLVHIVWGCVCVCVGSGMPCVALGADVNNYILCQCYRFLFSSHIILIWLPFKVMGNIFVKGIHFS